MHEVKRNINSRYIKPDHFKIPGHQIWTEDGTYYRKLYSLLSKLKVINTKKLVESLNANPKAR